MLSSLENAWQSIAEHTKDVTSEWERIIAALETTARLSQEEHAAALTATHWHDVGKNHPKWQCAVKTALTQADIDLAMASWPAAKFSLSESPSLRALTGYDRKKKIIELRQSFKPTLTHEVASALAFRQSEQAAHDADRPIESLLAEYLIMSHHGRVRKVLRDEIPKLPKEKDPETVRGVANGDEIPPVTIGGHELQRASLSTDCRRMGRDDKGNESYTRGVLRLLAHYGPFRLAFLETLFRAADISASIRASKSARRVVSR
jgi:CRISPR-associated endonuclease/helicase Cas3